MDLTYIRLQPSCQISLGLKKHNKPFDLFYGPYDIIEKMGSLVYRLKLSRDYKIHDAFHESSLKPQLKSSMWLRLYSPKVHVVSEIIHPYPTAIVGYKSQQR